MRFPAALALSLTFAGLLGASSLAANATPVGNESASEAKARAFADVRNLDHHVLRLALDAVTCARETGRIDEGGDRLLTVIDYSKASTQRRLWVLDLDRERLLFEELVAHGQGSGDNLATKFSNAPDSHQTSIGLFRTDTTYVGRNGYSLRLDGLDKGFNDRARERAIVMHGAPYVNPGITKTLGRLGRSHGCPAVRNAVAHELIDRVKGGGLVFAYYPNRDWLNASRYLNACRS